ncbi:hypothetical protein LPJ71_000219 [Coemansia sp. S17]|nr:hypothetical protein LPJ71_000219 [Coemansia sp. S17]
MSLKDDILNDIYGDHYYGDGYSDIDYEDEDMDNDNKDDDEDDDEYEDMDDENEEDEGEDDDEDEGEDDEADKDLLAREIAVVAVQIAVLCPNFKHVDLPEEMRNEFSREVALAMANGPFLPYANSLERLIFSE